MGLSNVQKTAPMLTPYLHGKKAWAASWRVQLAGTPELMEISLVPQDKGDSQPTDVEEPISSAETDDLDLNHVQFKHGCENPFPFRLPHAKNTSIANLWVKPLLDRSKNDADT